MDPVYIVCNKCGVFLSEFHQSKDAAFEFLCVHRECYDLQFVRNRPVGFDHMIPTIVTRVHSPYSYVRVLPELSVVCDDCGVGLKVKRYTRNGEDYELPPFGAMYDFPLQTAEGEERHTKCRVCLGKLLRRGVSKIPSGRESDD
jgi:hypothetical protein